MTERPATACQVVQSASASPSLHQGEPAIEPAALPSRPHLLLAAARWALVCAVVYGLAVWLWLAWVGLL